MVNDHARKRRKPGMGSKEYSRMIMKKKEKKARRKGINDLGLSLPIYYSRQRPARTSSCFFRLSSV